MEQKNSPPLNNPHLESWVVTPPPEHTDVVVFQSGASGTVSGARLDNPGSPADLVAGLVAELQATRAALTDAASARAAPESGTSLRERLLDKQVRELQAQVQTLTTDIGRLRSEAERKERERVAREERERMRRFSD